MAESLYWDDFERRIKETVECIKNNTLPKVRRVAVFITNKCNFRCKYCKMSLGKKEMSKDFFNSICEKYKDAIIHITGGEPSTVKWLYDYIDSHDNTFHLNSNGLITPPKNIKRLKVSLDTNDPKKFKEICGVDGFNQVVENIKKACEYTVVSITYVLSKKTYKQSPEFMKWARETFSNLYAVFFSCYKGSDEEFVMTAKDIDDFWYNVKPRLEREMDKESLWLFLNTIDEKIRIINGTRFPENKFKQCYISMSERVYDFNEKMSNCSHLYRDGIVCSHYNKNKNCLYGCNRKLVKFNQEVEKLLIKEGVINDSIKR